MYYSSSSSSSSSFGKREEEERSGTVRIVYESVCWMKKKVLSIWNPKLGNKFFLDNLFLIMRERETLYKYVFHIIVERVVSKTLSLCKVNNTKKSNNNNSAF